MKLDRAGGVMRPLQLQVSLMCLLWCIKAAFADALTFYHDLHKPFSLVGANTKKPGFIGAGWFSHILQISKTGYFPKIMKRVVLLVSVFVINVLRWKTSCHVKPCEAMREPFLIIDRNRPVPHIGWATGSFTDKIGATVMYFPNKLASLWVVVKDRSDMVSCNHEYEFIIGANK